MWCKIFFLTNVCVTFQGKNTSIFVKGSVLRSFITTVRWMLRWLERSALPPSKCLLSVVSYRCNCSIIMLILLTATTCLSTCRGCRGRGSTVRETTQRSRIFEKIEYNETFIRDLIYLDRSGWSELLQYFWSNGERDSVICKEDSWLHKQ